VRFLFRQTVVRRFADPLSALPIRITAGALGKGLSARDLLVSPAHAALIDDVPMQAGALVNGTTVMRETREPEVFTDWHIALADHAPVLAKGVPAETFLDSSDREAFDNWAGHAALLADAPRVTGMELPRAKSHRQVPAAVRARFADRAEALRGLAAA
jgi:hypothetical protein